MTVTCSCLARQARCTKDLIQTRVPMGEQGLIHVLPVSDFTNIFTKILRTFTNVHPSYDEKNVSAYLHFQRKHRSLSLSFEF